MSYQTFASAYKGRTVRCTAGHLWRVQGYDAHGLLYVVRHPYGHVDAWMSAEQVTLL